MKKRQYSYEKNNIYPLSYLDWRMERERFKKKI